MLAVDLAASGESAALLAPAAALVLLACECAALAEELRALVVVDREAVADRIRSVGALAVSGAIAGASAGVAARLLSSGPIVTACALIGAAGVAMLLLVLARRARS